ncbi:MAG: antibiotic biosynthesis monooxygenase [Propionibacteriaceae bacterium]|nr:antibiotic biosynthesis monooxygenase [Propionibacteriaceae bacterium]
MYRSMLYLQVKPGQADALIEWYKEVRVLEKAVEAVGCVSTEIYKLPDDPDQLFVTAYWKEHDDYQRWIDHPLRHELAPGVNQFMAETAEFTSSSRGALLESSHAYPWPI